MSNIVQYHTKNLNKLTSNNLQYLEACFVACATDFSTPGLSESEKTCVDSCAIKHMGASNRFSKLKNSLLGHFNHGYSNCNARYQAIEEGAKGEEEEDSA